MDARDLKKWRERLGYNQFEAAKGSASGAQASKTGNRSSRPFHESSNWHVTNLCAAGSNDVSSAPYSSSTPTNQSGNRQKGPITSAFCTLQFMRITKLPCSMRTG